MRYNNLPIPYPTRTEEPTAPTSQNLNRYQPLELDDGWWGTATAGITDHTDSTAQAIPASIMLNNNTSGVAGPSNLTTYQNA